MYENVPNMHGIIKRSSTDNSHDQAIKYAQTSKSSDQGQILDDQNLDPGRKRLDTLILGDPPWCVRTSHDEPERALQDWADAFTGTILVLISRCPIYTVHCSAPGMCFDEL